MGYRILVADDETEIRQLFRLYLEKNDTQVIETDNGTDALEICRRENISLALLDIMMPGMDGYRLVKQLRLEKINIPVIFISAKGQDEDKILGLDLGADDYIAKPFNPLEAVARINSCLRRFYDFGAGSTAPKTICVKDLRLEPDECSVYKNDEALELTSVEYKILKLFMENPGKVFTKQQLYEAGWEEKYAVDDNSIMVCMSKLRAKIASDGEDYIKTIRGLGYRLEK